MDEREEELAQQVHTLTARLLENASEQQRLLRELWKTNHMLAIHRDTKMHLEEERNRVKVEENRVKVEENNN